MQVLRSLNSSLSQNPARGAGGSNKALIRTLCFTLVLSCTALVQAQTDSTSDAIETRERRAPVIDTSVKDDSEGSTLSELKDVAVKSKSKQADKIEASAEASSPGDKGRPDRISVLRSQIKEAKTEVERVRLQRMLADYLVALNRKDEAVVELRSMLGSERLDAASYYNIGNGLARLGVSDRAIEAYKKAIDARQGNYPRALNNLGVVLLGLNRMDEAYDAFVLAIKQQNFRYAEASFNLGRLYAARDEADLAISEWTRAVTVQPDHVDAAVALARAHALTGQPDRGLEVIELTLKRTGANEKLETAREEIQSIAAARK